MNNYTFQTKTQFPFGVKIIEHTYIPLADGTHLAAKIWLPETGEKVPGILEFIPYRKRDAEAWQDAIAHHYFAGHGYAGIRVDLRGAGESEGILEDEYLLQEQNDGLEVIEWIAKQEWCNGNVGMMGISWGGFNGLQIAARQPEALKAIITVCSTDDRYADDVHYMGGCLLGDNLSWASVMFAFNSLPPDPELVGEQWRTTWLERLEKSELWLEKWIQHQHRDQYWQHGSVCEDYSQIQIPVFAISGWADGYSNAVFRMMKHLNVPRKGLIGPWSHKYPHLGIPGPAIGFLQEALRWWDQWLKGIDRGIEKDPLLQVWMQDSVPPLTGYSRRPGRWVTENEWPSPKIKNKTFHLTDTHLVETNDDACYHEETLTVQSPLSVGLFAGKWCSYSATPDLPHDQREEDGGALVFKSYPLNEAIEIMGAPELDLTFSSDQPVTQIALRLSDVAPDDKATRVTYGVFNLTHRNSHEHPEPLEPGKKYQVKLKMNEIAQHFPKGHRIRLSLSTSYWPLIWPTPEPARLTIYPKESKFHIPGRPPREEDRQLRPFEPPEGAKPITKTMLEPGHHNWYVKRDLAKNTATLEVIKDEGIVRFEHHGLEYEDRVYEWYTFQGDDFNSVRGEVKSIRGFRRGDWHIRTITRTILQSTPTHFLLHAELDAYEKNFKVFSKIWDRKIERKLV